MHHSPPRPHFFGQTVRAVRKALTLTVAALAVLTSAAIAQPGPAIHRIKLNTVMFAAQVGSTTNGGSVYAGALVDPRLGHGAIVFSANGTTDVRVSFHVFFALGSVQGTGSVTLVPRAGGQATYTGTFKVTGGTAMYRGARGKLTTTGSLDSTAGTANGTFTGTITP
jgi:hypothetical protein